METRLCQSRPQPVVPSLPFKIIYTSILLVLKSQSSCATTKYNTILMYMILKGKGFPTGSGLDVYHRLPFFFNWSIQYCWLLLNNFFVLVDMHDHGLEWEIMTCCTCTHVQDVIYSMKHWGWTWSTGDGNEALGMGMNHWGRTWSTGNGHEALGMGMKHWGWAWSTGDGIKHWGWALSTGDGHGEDEMIS